MTSNFYHDKLAFANIWSPKSTGVIVAEIGPLNIYIDVLKMTSY